jgi:phage shock protein PspC (stress-responsive transcriptional regulator)
MLFTVSATQGHNGAMRAEDAVKDFWATRPRRPRRGRKIAGVAAGIANRYRIDPVLVRVGLVVAAIYGGAGILVYLLGWLFLPEEDDDASPIEAVLGRGRSSTSSGFTVLLCIITVPVMGWFFGGSPMGTFPTWMSLLVMAGLLYLLHQSRGGLGPVPPAQATPAPEPMSMPMSMPMPTPMPMPMPSMSMPTTPLTPPTAPMTAPVTAPTSSQVPLPPPVGTPVTATPPPVASDERTTPPAWDPLGAAPFAWDLPEPAAPEPEEPEPPARRHKSRIGTVTIGLALVAAAGMSFAMGGWITPQHIVGVVLAVLGLGMVAGAFVRGGRGLIGLAVPLSVAGLALTMVSPGGYDGLGDLTARPTTTAAVQDSYERSIGDVTLDLTALPAEGVVETEASTDVGTVEVIVPENADVTVECRADKGNADCLGQSAEGLDSEIDEFTDNGADGPGGLRIILQARTDTGSVEVRRG